MTEVTDSPVLSGPEAEAHTRENGYELIWAAADEFDDLGLYPADIGSPLADLLSSTD